jgi:menaquinone-9 beta-reductase
MSWSPCVTAQPDFLLSGERRREARHDVVVVGAGLAGSGIAAALAQRGWDVLLVERERFPRHKVCGEFLSPEAQHSLQALGLLDEVAALGPVPLHAAAITTPGGATVEMALPADAWGLSRYALDARLAAAVERRGGQIWQGATVTSSARDEEGYVLHVRRRGAARQQEDRILRARAVLMACGRHSSAALPPHTAARAADKRGWRDCVGLKIHYRNVRMEPRVELYLFPGGYVGINPVEGDRANVCLLITATAFQAAGKSLACVLDMVAARHPLFAERLRGADAVAESECAVAPVDTQRQPAPWDAETGAACIGDTAAMIPPLAGDGMAMALRSAELCLEPAHAFLQGRLSLEGWAAAYSSAWQDEFGRRLRLSQALQSALTSRGLGDAMAAVGHRLPWAANWLLAGTRGRIA